MSLPRREVRVKVHRFRGWEWVLDRELDPPPRVPSVVFRPFFSLETVFETL